MYLLSMLKTIMMKTNLIQMVSPALAQFKYQSLTSRSAQPVWSQLHLSQGWNARLYISLTSHTEIKAAASRHGFHPLTRCWTEGPRQHKGWFQKMLCFLGKTKEMWSSEAFLPFWIDIMIKYFTVLTNRSMDLLYWGKSSWCVVHPTLERILILQEAHKAITFNKNHNIKLKGK